MPVELDESADWDNPGPRPPFCYAWLTPDDAVRHALAAFYQACRYADHEARATPKNEPTMGRNQWFDHMLAILEARVLTDAANRKTGGMSTHYARQARNTLEGYTEAAWVTDTYSDREATKDIHCRALTGAKLAVQSVAA